MQAELLIVLHFLKLTWTWHSLSLYCLCVTLKVLQYSFLCLKLLLSLWSTAGKWAFLKYLIAAFFPQFSFDIFRNFLEKFKSL